MSKFEEYRQRISSSLWSARRAMSGQHANVLFITCQNGISKSQIFPFYFFRTTLKLELGFDFREISLAEYENNPREPKCPVDIVFFQPWWDIDPAHLQFLLERIRHENPAAKIVFLDSYAPLDLRLAQFLESTVDIYVKKQLFRDRSQYGMSTQGDTNLVDYYGKLYGLEYPKTTFPISSDFLSKLMVGPGFATADYLLPSFMSENFPGNQARDVDLHARLGGSGDGWYGRMRNHARALVKEMKHLRVASEGAVKHAQYMEELRTSKLCFSPFGFGEVCWRDYEAVMCGSLLIKPDMGHVETDPDIFRPFETYIPVSWDFSDLEEKVTYYLKHEEERKTISLAAYQTLSNYFKNDGFLKHVKHMLVLK